MSYPLASPPKHNESLTKTLENPNKLDNLTIRQQDQAMKVKKIVRSIKYILSIEAEQYVNQPPDRHQHHQQFITLLKKFSPSPPQTNQTVSREIHLKH